MAPGAARNLLQATARYIGFIALILIEPSRQWDVMKKMCSGVQKSTWYFKMDIPFWTSVHSWNTRSKIAKGIEYNDGEIEEKRYKPEERFAAIANLRIVNSNRKLPVKKTVR